MQQAKILYFPKPGKENTEAVINCVLERLEKGDIEYVVVATTTGETPVKLMEKLEGKGTKLICVTYHAGYRGGDNLLLAGEYHKKLRDTNIPILICSHALSGVGRSITRKFGGTSPVELIAHTLRLFGHGVKVGVEIGVMAADAALIPTDKDVIAIGGSYRGADAAIVLKAAHQNNFFELKIKEILCKPRDI